jgi:hypothetical protein
MRQLVWAATRPASTRLLQQLVLEQQQVNQSSAIAWTVFTSFAAAKTDWQQWAAATGCAVTVHMIKEYCQVDILPAHHIVLDAVISPSWVSHVAVQQWLRTSVNILVGHFTWNAASCAMSGIWDRVYWCAALKSDRVLAICNWLSHSARITELTDQVVQRVAQLDVAQALCLDLDHDITTLRTIAVAGSAAIAGSVAIATVTGPTSTPPEAVPTAVVLPTPVATPTLSTTAPPPQVAPPVEQLECKTFACAAAPDKGVVALWGILQGVTQPTLTVEFLRKGLSDPVIAELFNRSFFQESPDRTKVTVCFHVPVGNQDLLTLLLLRVLRVVKSECQLSCVGLFDCDQSS